MTSRHLRPLPRTRIPAALMILVLASVLVPASARAGEITVASGGLVHIGDDGQCSLREAIANAEADSGVHADCPAGAGADVVKLPGGTYPLSSARASAPASAFVVTTDLSIVGSGHSARSSGEATILDAGGALRHFDVDDDGSLQLEALRLSNGSADFGGAVRAGATSGGDPVGEASFSATDVRFIANDADDAGGAVWTSDKAHTTLTDTALTGNRAARGAAILAEGALTLVGSLVSRNHAGNEGGAILSSGTTHITGSTIRDNTGTGLVNDVGVMSLVRSTVSGNDGVLVGGLLASGSWECPLPHAQCQELPATTTIRDSTFSGNSASEGPAAIWSSEHTEGETARSKLTLTNVTVADNDSPGEEVRASAPTVRNTVIAGGCDVTVDVYDGWLWSGDHNVSHDGSCSSGGFTQVDSALLGPLAFNGGPTATHMPHPASPLIDVGNQATCDGGVRVGGSATDQRGAGFPRTVGDACDIGAVEADAPSLLVVLASDVEGLTLRRQPGRGQEGLRTSLLTKLRTASSAVDRGASRSATGQLGAFREQVEAHAGKAIAEDDAHRLTTGALAIIELVPEG